MDRERWVLAVAAVRRAAARVGWNGGRRRPLYENGLIVAMYLWSAWHDRPLYWACRRSSYGRWFRPPRLPSASQFTRRIRSADCQRILQLAHESFAQRTRMTDAAYIDAKPLTVSPVSKDRDARRGQISGGFGRGYKLHALVNEGRRIVVWSVMGLNADEKTVARVALLPHAPPLTRQGLVMGDSNYDSAPLHRHAAETRGVYLLHPLRGQSRVGGAFRARKLRQMPASRRALVEAWAEHQQLVRFVLKARQRIEGVFGVLTCAAGGLSGLPAWVRGLERVRRWVGAKIILYNAHLAARQLHCAPLSTR